MRLFVVCCVLVLSGLILAATEEHQPWSPLMVPQEYDKGRMGLIIDELVREIVEVQEYTDSTLERVGYGWTQLSNGADTIVLSIVYDSSYDYLAVPFINHSYTYIETTWLSQGGVDINESAVAVTHIYLDRKYMSSGFGVAGVPRGGTGDRSQDIEMYTGLSDSSFWIQWPEEDSAFTWVTSGQVVDTVRHRYICEQISGDSLAIFAIDRNGAIARNDTSRVYYVTWKFDR